MRDDLRDAQDALLEHLRSPGTWWTGAERHAMAREVWRAGSCALCRSRKQALSPSAVAGEHGATGDLPAAVADVVHRVRSDPARLSRAWYESVVPDVLSEPRYVELIAVATLATGLEFFARAIGAPPPELPPALPGEPSRRVPETAKPGAAWVATIAPEDASGPEAGLYGGAPFVPNVIRALSLVPDEQRALWRALGAHYVPVASIPDPSAHRALDRMQTELVAARVSALNQCFY